jgi:hypothetical protein
MCADEFLEEDLVVSKQDAEAYAQQVAKRAIEAYIDANQNQPVGQSIGQTKGKQMSKESLIDAVKENANFMAQEVIAETGANAKIITGEVLLDNIETLAEKFVLSRLPWWKRVFAGKRDTELAVTTATYVIVYAIKTGGFGLTKYRINHAALEYVTLAANKRIMTALVGKLGVNLNVAEALFSLPEVEAAS